VCVCVCVCACVRVCVRERERETDRQTDRQTERARPQKQFLSQLVDFHKTRYEYKSTGGRPNLPAFSFRTPDNTDIDWGNF